MLDYHDRYKNVRSIVFVHRLSKLKYFRQFNEFTPMDHMAAIIFILIKSTLISQLIKVN